LPGSKFTSHYTLAQTRDRNGNVNDRTPSLGSMTLPLDDTDLQAVLGGKDVLREVTIDGEPLLVYSKPVTIQGHPLGIVQVAASLREMERYLDNLRSGLVAGSIAVTVLAFGIGWILAGTALRPINRITQTARAIGDERDFDRRVRHTGPNDEVGQLATTFNSMLTELQTAYRQVEQSLQAQRRFAADASHELRTPLTTIRGNIALLQREPPIAEEDRVAALGDMADETDRLIRLVNDLLVLARADAGRPLRHEPVFLKPLIEDLCRNVKLLEPDRTIDCDNLLDEAAIGNADAIKQVLLILLDNARKFTPSSGTITIEMRREGANVAVSVCDTGAGIAADALPHIFERFYRSDMSRTGEGAGLGLAIAKTLVEAQRGTISVDSVAGKGSTFTIRLPRATRLPEPEAALSLAKTVT
jgi:signal transduction histidine kinase